MIITTIDICFEIFINCIGKISMMKKYDRSLHVVSTAIFTCPLSCGRDRVITLAKMKNYITLNADYLV